MSIILISEIYRIKEEKERELEFYRTKLSDLEKKMFFVKKEIELTNFIIDLIEREKITDIAEYMQRSSEKM